MIKPNAVNVTLHTSWSIVETVVSAVKGLKIV